MLSYINMIIDILSLVHFVQYFFIALYIPNDYEFAIKLSVIWELFEYTMTNNPKINKLLVKYWPIPKKYWEEKNIYNRLFDIIFNMLGYYIGSKLQQIK